MTSYLQPLLFLAAVAFVQLRAADYSPCSYSLDISGIYYTIKCQAPLTADQVVAAFSRSPTNANIKELTIDGVAGMTDDVAAAILDLMPQSHATLNRLALDHNVLTRVPPQVEYFTSLAFLSVFGNAITALPAQSVAVGGRLQSLGLQVNAMTAIEAGAFRGDFSETSVGLQSNLLTRLDRDVYADVLESMVGSSGVFYFGGNPLECDCTIAWLVRDNRHLLDKVAQAFCPDGTAFADLDPAFYQDC